MTENRYTLNQRISTNNKGVLASYIDGIYDWYNNEKLDWYEVVDRLNKQDEQMQELEGENEQLKQKITELDSENEKLWETCYHTLLFARQEDITIKRNDRGHYHICSKNVTPKDSPIISITAPSGFFNDYILNHIIEAIDKISPVQEKEVDTDD